MRSVKNVLSSLRIAGAMCMATGLLLSIPGCTDNPVPYVAPVVHPTSISLSSKTLGVVMGTPQTLTATVKPSNATNPAVTWTSSNTAIATVANGVVTPVAAGGPVTITATTADNGLTATCAVTVTSSVVHVTGVTLNDTTLNLVGNGATHQLLDTIAPASATNTAVAWDSDNTATATVSSTGLVTTLAPGTAHIQVTAADTTNGTLSATCTVTVTGPNFYGFTSTGNVYTMVTAAGAWSATATNTSTAPTALSFVVSSDGNTFYGFSALPTNGSLYSMTGPTGTWSTSAVNNVSVVAAGSPSAGLTFDGTTFTDFTNTGKWVQQTLGTAWGSDATMTLTNKGANCIAVIDDGTTFWMFTGTGQVYANIAATAGVPSLSWLPAGGVLASQPTVPGPLVSVVTDGTNFYGFTATGLLYWIPCASAEAGTGTWTQTNTSTTGTNLVAVVYN